jgi:MoaA/NifB/PqqE/SkfB family radical SAM enzyme
MSIPKNKVKEILNSKNFCAYLYNHATIYPGAKWVPCNKSCGKDSKEMSPVATTTYEQYTNNEFIKKLKYDMDKNNPNSFCDPCFKDEALGINSSRIYNNQNLERIIEEWNLEDQFLDMWETRNNINKNKKDSPYHWQLYIDNICQARCVMCDHTFSSSIEKEYEKLNLPLSFFARVNSNNKIINDPNSIINEIKKHADSIKVLQILGGEPMLSDNCYNLLNYLNKEGHSNHIFLKINTNGITLPERYIDICKKFYKVQWTFSIDAFNELNHWIRYPTRWEKLCKNLERIKKENFYHVMIQSTVHAMNAHYLPELYDWVKQQKLHHYTIIVDEPNKISISCLTKKQRQALEKKYSKFVQFKKDHGDKILSHLNNKEQIKNTDLIYFIKKLEKERPSNFSDINEFFTEEFIK